MMAPGETMLQKKKENFLHRALEIRLRGLSKGHRWPAVDFVLFSRHQFPFKKKKRTTFTNISRETSFSVGRMAMKQNEWENDENRSDRDRNSSHGTRETKNDENPCGSVEKVNRRRKTKRTTEKKPNSTVA